ncbi:hypothetical protein Pcinc_024238 [Petrolisthes cinctipes]|uniref:Tyrosinase copper-binding domain-containing protein n=1 Tax=Petrolisthes cinctipes TaxID=88211 RepID=A0AAE1FBB5_PETCI|nr:hypothetical protein Pcinc_024238 [Petrolisthes cinctipes]
MRWTTVAVALLVVVAGAEASRSRAERQLGLNRLVNKITSPLSSSYAELKEAATNYDPTAHDDHFSDGGAAAHNLVEEIQDHHVLEQHHWFSLFNTRQREEALMLVDVLLHATDSDTFFHCAAYFREKMNEGEFIYAIYVAVTHSPVTSDLILPPLYEVTPHMFTNSEIINKAYTAKMTQTPGNFNMEFSSSKKNPETRVAYFGEDIGMNSHHVHWHMDFPFWWHGEHIDRKGELFFWAHHQLTARFDAERLSNWLSPVDELHWDRPIKDGFAPHTSYKFGGEFPTRPDNKAFDDVDGVARMSDMIITESRIRDAIAHGYIEKEDGTHVNIDDVHGIDVLGDVIESSVYSPNAAYYGALHNQAHRVLGAQADPHGKFNMPPGVMEHFETATRDPAFFRLHKYMDNIFKEHKDKLPPYTKEELLHDNIHITGVDVTELKTFFEDFENDLGNALDTTETVADVKVTAHVARLNHEPYTYNIYAHADHDETITVRVYLTPKYDENQIAYDMDDNRWGTILMDLFWVNVHAGDNNIERHSYDSTVAIPDRVSFPTLIQKAEEAVASGSELDLPASRACGHPQRLLLPKGNDYGMDFWLDVFISGGEDAVHDDLTENDHGGTHGYCGIHGQKYPDKKPMGYPFDRRIPDHRVVKVPNHFGRVVQVFHDSHHH